MFVVWNRKYLVPGHLSLRHFCSTVISFDSPICRISLQMQERGKYAPKACQTHHFPYILHHAWTKGYGRRFALVAVKGRVEKYVRSLLAQLSFPWGSYSCLLCLNPIRLYSYDLVLEQDRLNSTAPEKWFTSHPTICPTCMPSDSSTSVLCH